ncbi:MAG: hypothetical protein QF787_12255 [Nitrospinota bacterium]|jgi:hypothetical protein|nr:hypothetical protein [Nitrospinota bacterium]
MDINEYRNMGRKRVELPSGLAGFVRAPSIIDLATYPKLIPANMNGAKPGGGAPEDEVNREMYHCILRRCFIPDGGAMTDKELGGCLPGELSVHEITPEDAGAIAAALGELSRPGRPVRTPRFRRARVRRARTQLLEAIHWQARIYGLPPHLLARCTFDEMKFNQEVLSAGLQAERRAEQKNAARRGPGGGHRGGPKVGRNSRGGPGQGVRHACAPGNPPITADRHLIAYNR